MQPRGAGAGGEQARGAGPAGRGPGRDGTAAPLRTLAALTSARSVLQQPVRAHGGATWQWEGLEPSSPTPTPSPLAAPRAPAASLGPECSLDHRAQAPPGPLPSGHQTTAPRFPHPSLGSLGHPDCLRSVPPTLPHPPRSKSLLIIAQPPRFRLFGLSLCPFPSPDLTRFPPPVSLPSFAPALERSWGPHWIWEAKLGGKSLQNSELTHCLFLVSFSVG